MRAVVRLIALILLLAGTMGLLVNEFTAGWGRAATLILAGLNVAGLVMLVFSYWKVD